MARWNGILVASITPFHENGEIDFDALSVHLNRLADAGCAGVVMNAVSGEGGSLKPSERADAVRCACETLKGRAAVIASAGSVGDYETIDDIRNAAKAGAEGLMILAPYFYRLSSKERVEYFRRMGSVSDLDYMVYNTTYTSPMLSLDEFEAIAEVSSRFVGVKEGNQLQASELVRRLPDICVYTSRDSYISELGFAGGCGAVTYSSNVVPELTVDLWNAVVARDAPRALELQQKLNPIALGLVTRSFPSPMKAAMKLIGWNNGVLRAPLTELTAPEIGRLREILVGTDENLLGGSSRSECRSGSI